MSASTSVLAAKDVNVSMSSAHAVPESGDKPDVKSMEYHRQVLQSKMEGGEYVSLPSPVSFRHPQRNWPGQTS